MDLLYYGGLAACVVVGLFARQIAGVLYRRFSRLPPPAQDWKNPKFAPPAFAHVAAHQFKGSDSLPCCVNCGGGELHPVHSGVAFGALENESAAARMMAGADLENGLAEAGQELPGIVRGGDGFRDEIRLR